MLLASGLELLLTSEGFEVAAVAGTAPAFLAAVHEHRPDLTIVDVRLPPSFRDEGIRAALQARRERPDLPVLVLSQYVEQQYAAELLSSTTAGVGYLLKDRVSRIDSFVDALHRVRVFQETPREMKADKAGCACDEKTHGAVLIANSPEDALARRQRIAGGGIENAELDTLPPLPAIHR